jgi:hypothetical protein
MSTKSIIGVELPNGTVKVVYCHWDGYPEGVGADLISMGFSTTEQVEEFINEGDRSTVNLSYAEMRGEDTPPNIVRWEFPPNTYPSVDEYFASDLEEWGYLFTRDREWIVKDMYENSDPQPVETLI